MATCTTRHRPMTKSILANADLLAGARGLNDRCAGCAYEMGGANMDARRRALTGAVRDLMQPRAGAVAYEAVTL